MTLTILFAAGPDMWAEYERPLRDALAKVAPETRLVTEADPAEVDYVIYAPKSPLQDFTPYTRLKAVLNLWAGVETIVGNDTLKAPLVRMVDDEGLTRGMVEWVAGHVLRHHLGMDAHIVNPDHVWDHRPPPLAPERRVTILGLGALGSACAEALARFDFDLSGWSRSPKDLAGIACHAGPEGLMPALDGAEIVVMLLPNTPETENVLNAETISKLAPGAVVINPGRGPLIDDDALLAALDDGRLGHATLDVFRTEPLPAEHPFWAHPKVTVTPHIASETRVSTASQAIADNIARCEAGAPLVGRVDRDAGY
ncbi:hydroxyacid dehydrogenase [Roseivivax halodurans JCM 10272]|uniref:Hydroxyacid dehydrogenase n=1 Tax=Roseivivax halodurans JCM 10272 TaxID=1449350 RepID=X7EHX6_9RHOB|nr:glyoxylate/hydroxypyruvate reductase A [Roseivivax halodurans]ETX15460.1 hydroxyacid dehydrogenase [Roseivivax halodurans JCM 10272]